MASQLDSTIEARVKRLSRYYALLSAIYRFLTKPWEDELLRNQIHEAFRVARGLARL